MVTITEKMIAAAEIEFENSRKEGYNVSFKDCLHTEVYCAISSLLRDNSTTKNGFNGSGMTTNIVMTEKTIWNQAYTFVKGTLAASIIMKSAKEYKAVISEKQYEVICDAIAKKIINNK